MAEAMSDHLTANNLDSLTNEQLSRIAMNAASEHAQGIFEAAARLLIHRRTVVIAAHDIRNLIMPDICAACGQSQTCASSTVSATHGYGELRKAVDIKLPLCSKCREPITRLWRAIASDARTMVLVSVGGIAAIGMFVALGLAAFNNIANAWIAIFGIPAIVAGLVVKAKQKAIVKSWSQEDQAIFRRAKSPALLLYDGFDVKITFSCDAFAARFRELNATCLTQP
jgi:hypothetical protein